MKCIFCEIINRTAPASIVYEDDQLIAFDDIIPQAPVHKLIVPKQHIATLNDLTDDSITLSGHIIMIAKLLAKKFNINNDGYRVLFNCNEAGGQEIYHIHMHLLGGRLMNWPPG